MSVDLIYKKYGITKEEVMEWAKKTFPKLILNETILTQLYLKHVKGIDISPSLTLLKAKTKKIIELEENVRSVIEVVVGPKIREVTYNACPICNKKVTDGECPEHGAVEPKIAIWQEYIVGDDTGEIVVTIPPSVSEQYNDLECKVVRIDGILQENGKFMARSVAIISEEVLSMTEEHVKERMEKKRIVEQLKNVLKQFPNISYSSLLQWKIERGIEYDLDELLKEAGYRVEGEKIVPIEGEEEKEEEKGEEGEIPQDVIDRVRTLLSLFRKCALEDFKEWMRQSQIRYPLEKVLKASGAKIVREGEKEYVTI